MKKVYSVGYIYTKRGFQYPGIDIPEEDVEPYLNQLKDIVGEEKYQKLTTNQKKRDGNEYHITLLTPQEFEHIKFDNVGALGKKVTVEYIGLGKAKKNKDEAYFVVVSFLEGNEIRESLGLAKRDFHVTLGFKSRDVYGMPKDKTALLKT